jgi:hypothetical protein
VREKNEVGYKNNIVRNYMCYAILIKRPLGRPRRRWEDNIKMDLREIGIDGANWI